jgi:hypothetical protein
LHNALVHADVRNDYMTDSATQSAKKLPLENLKVSMS